MSRMTQTLLKGDRPSAPEPYLASTAKGRRERRAVLTVGTAAAAEGDDGALALWLIAMPRYTAVAAVRIYRDLVRRRNKNDMGSRREMHEERREAMKQELMAT